MTDSGSTNQKSQWVRQRINDYLTSHKEIERFLKFAVVGAIGAVVDSVSFNLLQASDWFESVHLNLGLVVLTEVGLAGAIAFFLAVISNFLWNRYWTYPDSRSKPILQQFGTFFLVNVFGIFIRIPILEYGSPPLGQLVSESFTELTPERAEWLGSNLAWAAAVLIVMLWNFFVNRYITYNDVE